MAKTPFENIESAREYVGLLIQQVQEVERDLAEDIAASVEHGPSRNLDALRLVNHKLTQLGQHLVVSSRILNDLRALRRLLVERDGPARSGDDGL